MNEEKIKKFRLGFNKMLCDKLGHLRPLRGTVGMREWSFKICICPRCLELIKTGE